MIYERVVARAGSHLRLVQSHLLDRIAMNVDIDQLQEELHEIDRQRHEVS